MSSRARFRRCNVALFLAICSWNAIAAPKAGWTLVRSSHFEVYSHSGERDAQITLQWLERLRAFFSQAGVEQTGELRVIGFESPAEYNAFRTQPTADAYFLSTEGRNYLVLPRLGPEESGVAAHEYAHLVLRSLDVRLPPWLAEGIAEFFSTVRIRDRECLIGGPLPGRMAALRQHAWMPLQDLLSAKSPMRADRAQTDIFYAESWALTDMLIFSPAYAVRFSQLLAEMSLPDASPATVAQIYGKSLDRVLSDLRAWIQNTRAAVPLPGIPAANAQAQALSVSETESKSMLADLLFALGKTEMAEAAYRALSKENPEDASYYAALGSIALRKGDRELAREDWKRAVELGIKDAGLCFQYAILAEDAGAGVDEVRGALERAIALKPDFDDARYKLGLLECNSGQYEACLAQLKSMRAVAPVRAYAYWTAVSTALTETDHRGEAKDAARQAMRFAANADERSSAARLAYVADTDLTVQLSRDANGKMQMVTARKPHGSDDWNPFVEPGDRILRLQGKIQKVECSDGKITGFRVEGAAAAAEVALPDPTHILIRGGAPEFICGAQDGRSVVIEYAASSGPAAVDGILRGMQFQ